MIVLEIDSGLGNQMFMYAAAKALALKHNTELYLDVDYACQDGYGIGQTYQLNNFNISAKYANREILKPFVTQHKYMALYDRVRGEIRRSRLVRKIASSLRNSGFDPSVIVPVIEKNTRKIYEELEEDWAFKPEFSALPDNIYIKGYFPSYKYFEKEFKIIKSEFTLRNRLSVIGRNLENKISSSNSISIHFRRGDVVSNAKYRSWYDGVVTDRYYRSAIEYFCNKISSPHFFIFSNEMDWVKENFRIPGEVTYVSHNKPETGYEDLYLMSRCLHNVTTGCSSFSWWAAYLNDNPEKIVIRTRRMNFHDHLNHPDDFFPSDWKIMES